MNGQKIDSIRKHIIAIFNTCQLRITIGFNITKVDFLDITFDIKNNIVKPFNKLKNKPIYINSKSNHHTNIVGQIPKNISSHISENSANEEIFDNAAPYYNKILKDCGYSESLKYYPAKENRNNARNRSGNIMHHSAER